MVTLDGIVELLGPITQSILNIGWHYDSSSLLLHSHRRVLIQETVFVVANRFGELLHPLLLARVAGLKDE